MRSFRGTMFALSPQKLEQFLAVLNRIELNWRANILDRHFHELTSRRVILGQHDDTLGHASRQIRLSTPVG